MSILFIHQWKTLEPEQVTMNSHRKLSDFSSTSQVVWWWWWQRCIYTVQYVYVGNCVLLIHLYYCSSLFKFIEYSCFGLSWANGLSLYRFFWDKVQTLSNVFLNRWPHSIRLNHPAQFALTHVYMNQNQCTKIQFTYNDQGQFDEIENSVSAGKVEQTDALIF